jgi:CrcB protein
MFGENQQAHYSGAEMTNALSVKMLAALAGAGAAGTVLRFCCLRLADTLFSRSLPYGTLLVNLSGAFLAGLLFMLARHRFPAWAPCLPIMMIGLLGAFTTFSSLVLETAAMFQDGHWLMAAAYLLLQNTGGLAAAGIGCACARLWN